MRFCDEGYERIPVKCGAVYMVPVIDEEAPGRVVIGSVEAQCDLPENHDGPCGANAMGGRVTWPDHAGGDEV